VIYLYITALFIALEIADGKGKHTYKGELK